MPENGKRMEDDMSKQVTEYLEKAQMMIEWAEGEADDHDDHRLDDIVIIRQKLEELLEDEQ